MRSSAGAGAGVALAVVASLALSACGGSATALTPTGSSTPTATSSSPTPSASPTAGPAGLGTLTGLPMVTQAQVDRPIVVVDVIAGPGHPAPRGLGQADVVYQEFDAAGRSRLLACFQSTDAASVGPVAQTSPVDWRVTAAMGLPILAFAGGPTGFVQQVGPTVVTPRSSTVYPSLFSHIGTSVFASTATLRASAPKAAAAPKGLITFGTEAATSLGARKVTHLTVTIPGHAAESWIWNGHYWIGPGGVAVTNVVVQIVTYKRLVPSNAPPVLTAQVLGAGRGLVVAGGVSVPVSWFRHNLIGITNYLDVHAVPVPLLPGRSWIILALAGSKAVTS